MCMSVLLCPTCASDVAVKTGKSEAGHRQASSVVFDLSAKVGVR